MIDGFRFFPITQMMMDQLIRGPGFMPPPQARPPMALNLIDHSPNSSNKVRKQIDYYFRRIELRIKNPMGFVEVVAVGALWLIWRTIDGIGFDHGDGPGFRELRRKRGSGLIPPEAPWKVNLDDDALEASDQ
ncbi:hypothetical protein Sjap_022566 [Stephania japonica]|uniref:Uncharacterized protein n=1 Tax=Stephania japonica TaxID=461633 RepID=A0AAP0EPK9_9MAGN